MALRNYGENSGSLSAAPHYLKLSSCRCSNSQPQQTPLAYLKTPSHGLHEQLLEEKPFCHLGIPGQPLLQPSSNSSPGHSSTQPQHQPKLWAVSEACAKATPGAQTSPQQGNLAAFSIFQQSPAATWSAWSVSCTALPQDPQQWQIETSFRGELLQEPGLSFAMLLPVLHHLKLLAL